MNVGFGDGLDALRAEIGIAEIASLIERTARWVDPDTFKMLPVWFPEHSRRGLFYNSNWSAPRFNRNRATGATAHKAEGNLYANKALTLALGSRQAKRPNWSCCHIWGVDDPKYQRSNDVVSDNRFYSCVANMVLLPTPLKAFTDTMPEIKTMMRICASNLYRWKCEHPSMISVNSGLDKRCDWSAYPKSWPRTPGEKRPLGVIDLTPDIEKSAAKRLSAIRHDLRNAGDFYPKEAVRRALSHWKISEAPER